MFEMVVTVRSGLGIGLGCEIRVRVSQDYLLLRMLSSQLF